MFRTLTLIAVTFALLLSNDSQADEPASKMLMLTQSAGFMHGSVRRKAGELAPAEVAMIQLGQQTKLFETTCTQDAAADITKENLQNYDIVMLYTTGKLPIADDDLEYFLGDWLKEEGHGLIGVHSSSDTYKDYEPYWDMIGGTFNGHPWGAGNTVTISVHEPDNPMMQPFGEEFEIRDEIYQYKNWQPEKVRVLMSLNMAKCNPKKDYMVPVAWLKEYGKGRVYYNNLGHNETTWTDQRFLDSLTTGVKWIRGEVECETEPNPELSEKLEEKAKADAGG